MSGALVESFLGGSKKESVITDQRWFCFQHSGQRKNMLIPKTSDGQSLLRFGWHEFDNLGLYCSRFNLSKGFAQSVQKPLFPGGDEQLVESNLTG